MKSKFFGFSAKLALAILAVGTTLTSCYDSENVDVIAPENPAPAVYYIAGNITNATTGEALTAEELNASSTTVTMNGADIKGSLTGNSFKLPAEANGTYTFVVDVAGYHTATRTVYTPVIADGGTSITNADIALVGALESDIVAPDTPYDEDNKDLASTEDAEVLLNTYRETILAGLEGMQGVDADAVTLPVDEDGAIRLVAPATIEAAGIGADVDVTGLPFYHGFGSDVDYSAETLTPTRALTEGSIWNQSAAAVLNRNYGFTVTYESVTLPGVAGAAINGYTLVVYFTTEKLSFLNHEGTVAYQSGWYVMPSYEGHDNHDLHNLLHGSHNGAGGGNTNLGY